MKSTYSQLGHGTMRRLSNQVAIVTGAGQGIGEAAALAFAREGACVVLADRVQSGIDRHARLINEQGGTAVAVLADVSRTGDVEALVEATLKRFGRLDCAFNNAGISGSIKPIVDLADDEFDKVIAVNLKGVWLSMKYELRAMVRQGTGGAIVNTSSFLAIGAAVGTSAYSASKAGLDGMIRAVALEVGPVGIRVNNVNPGVTDTPMTRKYGDDDALRPFAELAALKRLGAATDIADVAVWLCTNEARFITGQSVLVDGGLTIGGLRDLPADR